MKGTKDPLVGQTIDDKYRLIRPVGSGGMAQVYLAEELASGGGVAVKFLRSAFANLPGFVRRFQREAKTLSLLDHPNCVSVRDFGVIWGLPYLVMEFLDGVTLSEELRAGPMAVERILRIARELLAGLAHAHERAVVHRDLKPGNVMLVGHGEQQSVKIMDFGTAQLLTGEHSGSTRGTEIGTPWYMAPEQVTGQPADPRTDIYALGVILFEMLAGRKPYEAHDTLRVLQMQVRDPTPSLRALVPGKGYSPELEAVVVRAMQKEQGARFKDAAAFAAALEQVAERRPRRTFGTPRPVPPAPEPREYEPPATPGRSRARWGWLLLVVLVLAAAGGVLAFGLGLGH